MASSASEQLWTAPRAAKEREILFEAIANGSVVSWQHIKLLERIRFSGESSRIRSESGPQNWRPEDGLILGAAKRRISLYISGLCQISWRFTYLCWNIP